MIKDCVLPKLKRPSVMKTKPPKNDLGSSAPSAKKPYEAPLLKEWGTLKDITLGYSGSSGNDGGKHPRNRTS
jgi:hypothetical protein